MATLVLSAVGTALGGPVGGALGSLVGQAIDQQLLGSGPRKGPRLGDLSIQTASYGTMIPRLYGTMRVAGSVVWATDLKESEQAVSSGKGGTDTLRYSYTASFAVALSSRRALRLGRIWADGKLLRGAAGDLKVAGTLRFHGGGEDQIADPLIVSVEGIGTTPAFRSVALAVFEDLALADYGNRIPLLTFEVSAEEGTVSAGAVLADASGGLIDSSAALLLGGFAAHGADRRSAVTPLADVLGLKLSDAGGRVSDRGFASFAVETGQLGCAIEEKGAAVLTRSRTPLGDMPAALALTYYDPARDYQAGMASAGDAGGRINRAAELAAAVTADGARAIAEGLLARLWAEREQAVLHLPPAFLGLQPGDTVTGAGFTGAWDVTNVEINALVVTARLVRRSGAAVALPGDGGRVSGSTDEVAAPTSLALFDLPDLGGATAGLVLAAASAGPWRPVPVSVTANGVDRPALTVVRPSVLGVALTTLQAGSSQLIDLINFVDVQLVDPAAWLTSCDDDALAMGINLAALGDELIQFGRAEPIGPGRFRLSRLLRGRRASEWAAPGHGAGNVFVLIDAARLVPVDVPDDLIGAGIAALPHGLGDAGAVATQRVANGEALAPPSPCQLRVFFNEAGIRLDWVRRSRLGWAWVDGVDAPLGESAESYRVRIESGIVQREWLTTQPLLVLTAEDLTAFGGGPATVKIAQIGDRAASRETQVTINL